MEKWVESKFDNFLLKFLKFAILEGDDVGDISKLARDHTYDYIPPNNLKEY